MSRFADSSWSKYWGVMRKVRDMQCQNRRRAAIRPKRISRADLRNVHRYDDIRIGNTTHSKARALRASEALLFTVWESLSPPSYLGDSAGTAFSGRHRNPVRSDESQSGSTELSLAKSRICCAAHPHAACTPDGLRGSHIHGRGLVSRSESHLVGYQMVRPIDCKACRRGNCLPDSSR